MKEFHSLTVLLSILKVWGFSLELLEDEKMKEMMKDDNCKIKSYKKVTLIIWLWEKCTEFLF
jgi:hypothetical protein